MLGACSCWQHGRCCRTLPLGASQQWARSANPGCASGSSTLRSQYCRTRPWVCRLAWGRRSAIDANAADPLPPAASTIRQRAQDVCPRPGAAASPESKVHELVGLSRLGRSCAPRSLRADLRDPTAAQHPGLRRSASARAPCRAGERCPGSLTWATRQATDAAALTERAQPGQATSLGCSWLAGPRTSTGVRIWPLTCPLPPASCSGARSCHSQRKGRTSMSSSRC